MADPSQPFCNEDGMLLSQPEVKEHKPIYYTSFNFHASNSTEEPLIDLLGEIRRTPKIEDTLSLWEHKKGRVIDGYTFETPNPIGYSIKGSIFSKRVMPVIQLQERLEGRGHYISQRVYWDDPAEAREFFERSGN